MDLSEALTTDSRAELEKLVIGPSGNLRAPSARTGSTLIVGFNEDMWSGVF